MYQIITDSCCDIPADKLNELQVSVIPMIIELDGKEYIDDSGQKFNYSWFLEKLKENAQPTTSQVNVGRYLEFFRPYVVSGMPILYIAFSSGLSGSYNSALQAVDLLKEEYPEVDISVIDSKAASLGQGFLVVEAAELKKQGKTRTEVTEWLESHKMKLHSWVTVDDLKQLERGGRISKTAATIGEFLNVKPIIVVDRLGKLQNVSKVRGRKKALQKIYNEICNNLSATEIKKVYCASAGDENATIQLQNLFNESKMAIEFIHYPMGPTISSHTGYGCIALFAFGKER